MRYTKTIWLSIDDITRLENGTMRLQPGQWVQIMNSGDKSRFVGRTSSGSLWFVHGLFGFHSTKRFLSQCDAIKYYKGAPYKRRFQGAK